MSNVTIKASKIERCGHIMNLWNATGYDPELHCHEEKSLTLHTYEWHDIIGWLFTHREDLRQLDPEMWEGDIFDIDVLIGLLEAQL